MVCVETVVSFEFYFVSSVIFVNTYVGYSFTAGPKLLDEESGQPRFNPTEFDVIIPKYEAINACYCVP